MKIRWNRQTRFPLLLLLLFYAVGASELTDRYWRGDSSLPGDLAAGIERVGHGLNRAANALSRMRIGSWLGNSWAPGSIGWATASASSPPTQPPPPFPAAPALTDEAAVIDIELLGKPATLPMPLDRSLADPDSGVRMLGCGDRPLLVLTRTEVVVVTAEFPRIEAPEVKLTAFRTAPDRPSRSGCRPSRNAPKSST